ncbi:28S ribosomal protein L42, mitochondrial [Lemmus lemmus]
MAAVVKWVTSSRTIWKHLFPIQNGALSSVCRKSTHSSLPDDYNCKVELALTSDGRTVVCTTLLWTSLTNTRNLSLNQTFCIIMKKHTNKC